MLGSCERHQYVWFLAVIWYLKKKLIPKDEKHCNNPFKRKYEEIYFVA